MRGPGMAPPPGAIVSHPLHPTPPEECRLSDEITRSGQPGLCCGSYVLERFIDCGGFSEVWEARHPGHDKLRAAVKLLRPQQTADARRRFEQEGKLIAEIDHENVVG